MAENQNQYRSIANPRRTTLAARTVEEAVAPHRAEPVLTLLAEDAPACVDGVCAVPE
jgi:hypothetical protein